MKLRLRALTQKEMLRRGEWCLGVFEPTNISRFAQAVLLEYCDADDVWHPVEIEGPVGTWHDPV